MGKRKFDYSRLIVVLCFLCVFITLGFCSSGRTMYLTAITDALDIKRGAFSLNDTFRFIATTVLNIFFGTLVNRFGTKKLICAGFGCLIAFALINSFAEHLFLFYLAGILLGIGLSWTGTAMMSTVVNEWCEKNKGAMTGAILAANGLGGAVSVQILSPIIFEEGNPFGYRNSYRLVAMLLAIVLVLIVVFFRERPKGAEKVLLPKSKKRKVRGNGWVGMDYAEVVKKPYFYLALICMTFTGMSLQGLSGIATPHMYDLGMDKAYVATLMTVGSLCLMCSKILVGVIYDRVGIRTTMNISLICTFLSLGGLVILSNSMHGQIIAFIRAVVSSVAMPLETVMLPFFAAELFGNKCFAKVLGLFSAASTAGFAVGAPFANLCYDVFGNYNVAFAVFAVLMLFVSVTLQFVLRASMKEREKILASLLKEEGGSLAESVERNA